jgi:hypothetical protein
MLRNRNWNGGCKELRWERSGVKWEKSFTDVRSQRSRDLLHNFVNRVNVMCAHKNVLRYQLYMVFMQ